MGSESFRTGLLERSMFLFCSQRTHSDASNVERQRLAVIVGQRRAMAIVVRSSAGQSMGAITERVDDGTGQDLKFSARHLTRQFNAQQNELLSQNHTRYTSNILINYF